jgi:integrase
MPACIKKADDNWDDWDWHLGPSRELHADFFGKHGRKKIDCKAYRDTKGPGRSGVRRLLEQLADRSDAKASRDRAIIRCLYTLGLRRKEVVGLDLEDLDLETNTLAVLGKGRSENGRSDPHS